MRGEEQRKITYQGIVTAVLQRSNVWRYRLDNRTHSTAGYNVFMTGVADGEEREFVVAISEIRQGKLQAHIGDEICTENRDWDE